MPRPSMDRSDAAQPVLRLASGHGGQYTGTRVKADGQTYTAEVDGQWEKRAVSFTENKTTCFMAPAEGERRHGGCL